jgi:hypothetical protein
MLTRSAVAPEAIMALAVLESDTHTLELEQIAHRFVQLKEKGVPIPPIRLRRIPGGYYSEDIEAFVGRQAAAGNANAKNPVSFNQNGIDACKRILANEIKRHPEEIREVADALGIDLNRYYTPNK